MGSSSGQTTSSQVNNPWPGAEPALKFGLERLQGPYNQAAKVGVPHGYGLADQAAPILASTIRGDFLNGNPYLDEMTRRAMADVDSRFSGGSRYGSGAHQDALMRAVGAIRYQNYNQERQNQMQAIGAAPNYDLAPFEMYSARVAAPYENISRYSELANLYGHAGSQSNLSQPIYRNRTAGALGGAAAGAAAGSMFGPWGTAIGAVGGGLLGAYG